MLSRLSDIISKTSPYLAAAISASSPSSAILMSLLQIRFGTDNYNDLVNRLNNDDAKIKLKELELQLKQIQSTDISLAMSDKKSAREMAQSRIDYIPSILSLGFLFIYACIQWHVITTPGVGDDIISARVQDIVVMIIGFYFGSSNNMKNT